VSIFILKNLMEDSDYYKVLQNYIDNIERLKEWLHKTDDDETIKYLNLEIDKQINKMREHINNKS